MEELSRSLIDHALCEGACGAGIATVKTLKGGPPSADITYVLPEAKSAVSFAVALDQRQIMPFLMKKDHLAHVRDNHRTNALASGIGLQLAAFLTQKGFPSVPVVSNKVYRTDTPNGPYDLMPDISHRYLAVRSGVGFFGLSGNALTGKEGAAVILGSVVTTAELEPTDPLPSEENYCDECRLCMSSCISGLMDPAEVATVNLGGMEFRYAKRRSYRRCEYVCGGFAGLHPSGKWSTWSPARFPIPEKDEDFSAAFKPAAKAYWQRPAIEGGNYHFLMKRIKVSLTCGNCQLICTPDKEERKRRFKMLTGNGVVIQDRGGSLKAVSPDEAMEWIASMSPRQRALYEMT